MKFEQTNHERIIFSRAPLVGARWRVSCASEMNFELASFKSFIYMALPLFAPRDITRGQTENLTCTVV